MKLLMIYCEVFAYTPTIKTLDDFPEFSAYVKRENVLVGFIQMEEQDVAVSDKIETKLVKNLKWGAGKNQVKHIILHSFAHLSGSKADPHSTKNLFDKAEARLKTTGYMVEQTPFGYFLDLEVKAPGHSTARIFLEF